MSGMTERAITAALAPIKADMKEYGNHIEGQNWALDALIVRAEECEKG